MSHTTLSIDKAIYQKTVKRAEQQHLSVSAIARMLLDAYAEGRISIMAIQVESPLELRELSKKEITPKMRKAADKTYKASKAKLINIPT